jgi:hypothetical protein
MSKDGLGRIDFALTRKLTRRISTSFLYSLLLDWHLIPLSANLPAVRIADPQRAGKGLSSRTGGRLRLPALNPDQAFSGSRRTVTPLRTALPVSGSRRFCHPPEAGRDPAEITARRPEITLEPPEITASQPRITVFPDRIAVIPDRITVIPG